LSGGPSGDSVEFVLFFGWGGGGKGLGAYKGTMAGRYTESLVCLLGTDFNLAQVQVWL